MLVVDDKGKLKGLITIKDIEKIKNIVETAIKANTEFLNVVLYWEKLEIKRKAISN